MSGIVAVCGPIDVSESERMLSRLAHRGPDGQRGVVIAGNWIGSRWTESDITSPQPVVSNAGNLHMVADGEVYNQHALAERLGVTPERASIDIALPLFESHGTDAFTQIDGPFAIVIANDDGEMVVARDSLGIRPLYWCRNNNRVLFASELGAFDDDSCEHLESFPPGHVWSSRDGLQQFAEPAPGIEDVDESLDRAEILTRVREELIDSVETRMMNDTDVASFLSGGLDSSLIAAIAQRWMRERGETLKTFAVGQEGSPDILAARQVADYLETDHHELTYTAEEALEILPEVVRVLENFDPALVRSSVANYILAKFTARHADVVLTGEGSDELFAGYDYLREFNDDEALHEALVKLFEDAHWVGLQRVDRTATIHGLAVRLPFLSRGMVEVGMTIPPEMKRIDDGQVEKRLLREAFEGWLPEEILWRTKAEFGDGSGAIDALQLAVEKTVPMEEFEQDRFDIEPPLRSREEMAYYQMFTEHLGTVRPEHVIGRSATV